MHMCLYTFELQWYIIWYDVFSDFSHHLDVFADSLSSNIVLNVGLPKISSSSPDAPNSLQFVWMA